MRLHHALVALAVCPTALAAQALPLTVMRHTPSATAATTQVVTVTFDRPVAGRLDATIPAHRVVRIEPAIRGKLEWRDPVTIRLIPDAPLPPGSTYAVTVDTTVRAMDGGRLAQPYRFSFHVPGPSLLWRSFQSGYRGAPGGELPLDGSMLLLYSAPVERALLEREAQLELAECRGQPTRRVPLRVSGPRSVRDGDPPELQYVGGWDRDRSGDQFRRIVELSPSEKLPEDCAAQLVLPNTADDSLHGVSERFALRTAPEFRIKNIDCAAPQRCATDAFTLAFTAAVKRSDLLKHVRLAPDVKLVLEDPSESARAWRVKVALAPRTTYTVIADRSLRDVPGRPLAGAHRIRFETGDRTPAIGHASGLVVAPRTGARTFPLRHVNVRSVRILSAVVPERAQAAVVAAMTRGLDSTIWKLAGRPETTTVALDAPFNVERTTEIAIPAGARAGASALVLMRIQQLDAMSEPRVDSVKLTPMGVRRMPTVVVVGTPDYRIPPVFVLAQLTDLAVHAKIGAGGGLAFVTRRGDGAPVAGARVRQLDGEGHVLAEGTTDARGVARLPARGAGISDSSRLGNTQASVMLAEVEHAGDRLVTPVSSRTFGWNSWEGLPSVRLGGRPDPLSTIAAAVFSDRGIYRPGEWVHVKGVVREGPMGALVVPVGDSARVRVTYRPSSYESDRDAVVHDTVLALSSFGTLGDSLQLRPGAALGRYAVELEYEGRVATATTFEVAEYRAPEFLLSAKGDTLPHFGGDSARVDLDGRYLFGAPMAASEVEWTARLQEVEPWDIRIPRAEGWSVGAWSWWDDDHRRDAPRPLTGQVMLDREGRATVRVPLAALRGSRPGRLVFDAALTDVNRQAVTTSAQVAVHPARIYLLARDVAKRWYWQVGSPTTLELRAVRPDGVDTTGVGVSVEVVRRRMRWEGRWRSTDSVVRRAALRTGASPARFSFVPEASDLYEVRLVANDGRGGTARTTLSAWAFAGGPGSWGRSDQHHLPLVADRRPLAVGDSTSVLFDSPFEEAEALVTVEREGVLEQRRSVVRRGANVVPLRISAEHVPNVFVSVLLVRRGAASGERPDSTAQLLRVGFAELKVATDSRRLAVSVRPMAREYRPSDTATVRVAVRDAAGRAVRGEVTLWAVDEGVLALTDYVRPDLIDRMYATRGLGSRMASTLTSALIATPPMITPTFDGVRIRGATAMMSAAVVTGIAASDGGPPMVSAALRSRFRSTAFFVGAARTNDAGDAEVRAALPDNLTTYRLMAVAVDSGTRFGGGDSTLLVTRQLVARPALPRFVRASDTLLAGAVVNVRDGGARPARVEAEASGIRLQGEPAQVVTLAAGKGAEARFGFTVPPRDSVADSVVVRLRAADGAHGDAVETVLPVRPDFHTRSHTTIGMLRDAADVVLLLPAGTDPARSRLSLRVGTSPLAPMLAAYDQLRVYPYYCTEQISSGGRALLAVMRATGGRGLPHVADPRARVKELVDELARRQRPDGAIRYWNDVDWSSPWLSAYAGMFLLEAREAGIAVDSGVVTRLARWLDETAPTAVPDTGGRNRFERRERRLGLANHVALVEFLRRVGEPDEAAEDSLLRVTRAMTWEDRLRLAEVLAGRENRRAAADALLDAAWRAVSVAGSHVDLPDSVHAVRPFPSRIAPAARLLTATLAIRPDHPLLGGLVETVLRQGRAERGWAWSTQDYAGVVLALARLQSVEAAPRTVRVLAGRRELATSRERADSVVRVSLEGLLARGDSGERVKVRLEPSAGTAPVFYALTVDEVPSAPPVTPDAKGITVERWYERFDDGQPVTSVREGELVRVRLRVTVPADREFVAVEDPLPAGLEAVDLSLATSGTLAPFEQPVSEAARRYVDAESQREGSFWQAWAYGRWEDGWWSPWEHREMRDDRVVYFARMLWTGSYTATYVARATTNGSFVRPPAHAEEMYDPAVQGRSDGGRFGVTGGKR